MLKITLLSLTLSLTLLLPFDGKAQFYTIKKNPTPAYIILPDKKITAQDTITQNVADTIEAILEPMGNDLYRIARNRPKRNTEQLRKRQLAGYPRLTIANLMEEIKRNGIQYPKIVLAQAILETGWFSSNVCRTKNNLFGLTNPRTGQYYEFNHWTESVRAYYTKVQYRYKGGNYLLWLKKIGYAEAPDYIQKVGAIVSQYMLD